MPMKPLDELFAASRAGDAVAARRVLERARAGTGDRSHPIWG